MKITQFFKKTSIKSLFTVLMVLQLSACYFEEASAPDTTNTTVNTTANTPVSSVKLSWVAPVARTDESPISMADIAGFRVYYGTTKGVYPNYTQINDAYAQELAPNELTLPSGTYYAVMTTIDVAGRESEFSDEVTLNI